ncbi:MAG: hypothetical protein EZS28_041253 [Streblomastix strix]|uniref:Uncharacterized protein n=1 Tax=Streblomastix strix TaxID=222440 RepID=A0A5J4TYT3_9EUKA|nr:MAG: hypothetical protein EZS28_041253 [Streblomastix strix]
MNYRALELDGKNIYSNCCTLQIQFSTLTDVHVTEKSDKQRDFTSQYTAPPNQNVNQSSPAPNQNPNMYAMTQLTPIPSSSFGGNGRYLGGTNASPIGTQAPYPYTQNKTYDPTPNSVGRPPNPQYDQYRIPSTGQSIGIPGINPNGIQSGIQRQYQDREQQGINTNPNNAYQWNGYDRDQVINRDNRYNPKIMEEEENIKKEKEIGDNNNNKEIYMKNKEKKI